jgi:hypothetical protein
MSFVDSSHLDVRMPWAGGFDMPSIRHYDTVGTKRQKAQHRARIEKEESVEASRGSRNGDPAPLPFFPALPFCDVRCGKRRMPYGQ